MQRNLGDEVMHRPEGLLFFYCRYGILNICVGFIFYFICLLLEWVWWGLRKSS